MDEPEMAPVLRRHQFEHDPGLAVLAQADHQAIVDPLHGREIIIPMPERDCFARRNRVAMVNPFPALIETATLFPQRGIR
jgi:hypothetical protein